MKISFNKYSPITDHKGNHFDSIVDCCEAYDISINLFKNRFLSNWSIEKILTTPTRKVHTSSVKDHLGNIFPSISDMCNYYGIDAQTFYVRKSNGSMTLEQMLTTPKRSPKHRLINPVDGTIYESVTELAKCTGYPRSTINGYLRKNYTVQQILDMAHQNHEIKPVSDHLGNVYPDIPSMCRHYDLKCNTYYNRISKGWTLKEALTTVVQPHYRPCTDHLGNVFPSKIVMCNHYGINPGTYSERIRRGWNTEEALTTAILPPFRPLKPYTDHLGNVFPTIKDMCKHYGVSLATYGKRIKKGWTLKETLTSKTDTSSNDYSE